MHDDDMSYAVRAMRQSQPLVHCLTNMVAAPLSANALLAAGASPAMVDNPHEARATAAAADAVLINLGTPQEETVEAMREAVAGALDAGTPWVLDPIGAGTLPWRSEVALELLELGSPAIIRGNASEILGLAGGEGGRGVDSRHRAEDVMDEAARLATRYGTVVAVSGEVDHLTDGEEIVRLANGSPLLTQVSGAGCALGALMAACAASGAGPLAAAAAGTAMLTVAADRAAEGARGPGSFAAALLDQLALLSPETLAGEVRRS
ncbi:hydroxyethylthiazole kinase [Bogoriella caseilytica]|uniref:Hydroxyethylthiazole kinase n=1 Tax=Bogoriella caseilytica TaxID=56055 RepID=A0A3N2BC58_9MICO|nr:hydroxyethylthiazole kinase [Bogoriella caseilytica]ROR72839.1 hydroxyethylthiazole kinase [Bogoriella caseilytica]